ncbi:immunoglobulin lambda-1 light chain-like [Cheilinus undulatus]|uniref:immunoglobulin lambda-1 light chain-like n=1 Tax=Cheilinus undulatus TaxID=241271 RepID=UPI001BD532CB|nr:immunoglobulin lambda-1 light chain-like [Cheilinus undulatus]
MLLLPAAALCCLCSALVSTATELIQDDLTLTRRVGGNVSFSCGGTDQCSTSYVFWYQKKESDTFRGILLIGSSDGVIAKGYSHPQEDDFSSVNKGNGWELQIQRVNVSHSASYFCSCYYDPGNDYYIFGSGTKLVVTDHEVLEPVVSLYSAASRDQQEEKSPLLCVASAMFPPLVQISWKRQKDNGPLEEVPPAEGEQLEIRESGPTSSILLINQTMINQYQYLCSVKHEGNSTSVSFHKDQQINPGIMTFLLDLSVSDDPFRSECRVRLLTLLYSVLIVKSLVYCCGLCLLTLSAEEP